MRCDYLERTARFLLTIHNITERKLREQQLEEERARLNKKSQPEIHDQERYRFGELGAKVRPCKTHLRNHSERGTRM